MNKLQQGAQFIEGHFNNALSNVGLLPNDMEQLAKSRFDQCLTCHSTPKPYSNEPGPGLRNNQYCNQCGCDMLAKTKAISATCPAGRW